LVLLLAAGHALAMADRHLFAVAAPAAAAALSLRDGTVGFVLGTAFAIAYAAAAVPLGRLADRGWRRRLLIGGAILWTAASAATGLSRSAEELIAARIALGVGQAAFIPAALALLIDGTTAETRPGRLAVFTTGSTLGRSGALLGGGAVLWLLSAAAIDAEWRWLFAVTALPNLLLIALLIGRGDLNGGAAMRQPLNEGFARPLRLASYLLLAVTPLLVGQAGAGWFPTLLVRTHGVTVAHAGILIGAVTLIAAPMGQLLGGVLARHWSPMRRIPALLLVAGLWSALPAMWLATQGSSLPSVAAGIAGVNLTLGVASFAGIYGWQALLPSSARGVGNGAFMAVVTVAGIGTGPLLTGTLSQWGGGGGAALGTALLMTGVFAAMLATIAAGVFASLRPGART
jgi:predicted MFS family arabinose efflux permease